MAEFGPIVKFVQLFFYIQEYTKNARVREKWKEYKSVFAQEWNSEALKKNRPDLTVISPDVNCRCGRGRSIIMNFMSLE